MTTITPERIADLITTVPGWASECLENAGEKQRREAAETLAQHIYCALFHPIHIDVDQFALPL